MIANKRRRFGKKSNEVIQQLRHAAIQLLARREHSAWELQQKLTHRTDDPDLIPVLMTELQQQGLQSDRRFAESYSRSRIERGYGPLVIQAELSAKGVDEQLIADTVACINQQATHMIGQVYNKKYADQPIVGYQDKVKRMQFLQRRGFSHEQIKQLFNSETM